MAKSKIHINPENRGKFTAKAKAKGKGVQEYARQVLANKDNYSPSTVKQANFARNASKWKKEEGGQIDIYDVMPYSYYSMSDAQQRFPEGGQVQPIYTNDPNDPRYRVPLEYITSELEKKEYGGYAETGYPYSVQDDQNFYQTQIQFAQQSLIPNTGFTPVPIPSPDKINSKTFVNPSPEYSSSSDSSVSKSPKDLLTGLSIPKEQSSNKVPKSAGAKADIAGAAFNAAGTAMQALAPPDSKFGKAMQKGNSFAQAAEPLRALDMAVPGLGTAAVEAARLAGAITGGVQAKNEEIQTDRIEDTTAYLNRYDNMNFSKMNQGNYLSRYGSNIRSYQQGGQPRQSDMLIQEIFMDFDNWLGSK